VRFAPILALAIMLVAGCAAAAATQVRPEAPGLLGALAVLLGCGGTLDPGFLALEVLDELDVAAAFELPVESAP
jgi:hypothetical protein